MFRLLPLLLIIIPVLWFSLTFGPALKVETEYQLRQLMDVAGADQISELFWPGKIDWDIPDPNTNRQNSLVIPKIRLNETIVFNVDPNDEQAYTVALKNGVAHASGTSFPGSGGLGYYFAHSAQSAFTRQFKAVFYLLGKLEPGDEVLIWREGQKHAYKVIGSEITSPNELSFLSRPYDKETIVMQTCWPLGFAHQRKLVFAERVD